MKPNSERYAFEFLMTGLKPGTYIINGLVYILSDFAIRNIRERGPRTVIKFWQEPNGNYTTSSCTGGQYYYYVNHPDEIFWKNEQHKDVDGYKPLVITSLDQIQKGDAYFNCFDELTSVRSQLDMFGDFYEAPASNLRKRRLRGGGQQLLLESLCNNLYRPIKPR